MRRRVLIIEDDLNMRRLLYSIFSIDNNVIAFETGIEALKYLDHHGPTDLIIVDLEMPVMSGYDVIKFVKSNYLYQDIPVIVLSANEYSQDKIKAYRLGANDFVNKPFNPMVLSLKVGAYLNEKNTL